VQPQCIRHALVPLPEFFAAARPGRCGYIAFTLGVSRMHHIVRRLAAALLVAGAASCFLMLWQSWAHRTQEMIFGRQVLIDTQAWFLQTGNLTNGFAEKRSASSRVYFLTNNQGVLGARDLFTIAYESPYFEGAGALTISTNGLVLWLGASGTTKRVDSDYRARFFPPGF
jgi:hypothetical protein